jgi:hypothetical protein
MTTSINQQAANLVQIAKANPDAYKRFIKIGETLHAFVGTEEVMKPKVDALIANAYGRGRTVIENGISTFIRKVALVNTREHGSAQYKWHADGNRVKCKKFLVTVQPDGSQRQKAIGYGWTSNF